jgi:hypothetical protein
MRKMIIVALTGATWLTSPMPSYASDDGTAYRFILEDHERMQNYRARQHPVVTPIATDTMGQYHPMLGQGKARKHRSPRPQ